MQPSGKARLVLIGREVVIGESGFAGPLRHCRTLLSNRAVPAVVDAPAAEDHLIRKMSLALESVWY